MMCLRIRILLRRKFAEIEAERAEHKARIDKLLWKRIGGVMLRILSSNLKSGSLNRVPWQWMDSHRMIPILRKLSSHQNL